MSSRLLDDILTALDIPAPARAVYGDLVTYGASSARAVATRLSMTRPSVYDQLRLLIARNLIVERSMDGRTEFMMRDLSDVEHLLSHEEERFKDLRQSLSREKKTLVAGRPVLDPRIRFFRGREAIVIAMHDMLWDDRVTLCALWPYDEMIRAVGGKELAAFNEKRIRNNLRLRTIWAPALKQGHGRLWQDRDIDVERRYAPAKFAPDMAYTIYGDKVLFISSAAEAFGFVVQSADFARLMQLQFDAVWNLSAQGRR